MLLICCNSFTKPYNNIVKDQQTIWKIKAFINQYKWKEINFLSIKKKRKKFESNIKSIAINILHVRYNTEEIRPAYVSKYNLKRKI